MPGLKSGHYIEMLQTILHHSTFEIRIIKASYLPEEVRPEEGLQGLCSLPAP